MWSFGGFSQNVNEAFHKKSKCENVRNNYFYTIQFLDAVFKNTKKIKHNYAEKGSVSTILT